MKLSAITIKFGIIALFSLLAALLAQASWFYDYETGESDLILEERKGKRNFDSSAYPFSAIGLLYHESDECTAFLVSANYLLTAAHCVVDNKNHVLNEDVRVSFNSYGDRYFGPSYLASLVLGGWNPNKKQYDDKNDWYLLKVDEPIGKQYGWIGLKDSYGNVTSPSQTINDKVFNSLDPIWLKTSTNILTNLRKLEPPWLLSNELLYENYHKTMAILPTFQFTTTIHNEDSIYYPMSIAYDCHLRGYYDSLIINDCNFSEGGSGSSLIEINNKKPYAIAISARGRRLGVVLAAYKRFLKIYFDLNQLRRLVDMDKTKSDDEFSTLLTGLEEKEVDISKPITTEKLDKLINKYLKKIKYKQSSLGNFQVDLSADPLGSAKRDYYNSSVPTDTFFQQIRPYLK